MKFSLDFDWHRRPKFDVFVEKIRLYDMVKHEFTEQWAGVFIQTGWRAVSITW
jgi:hypothetical protein